MPGLADKALASIRIAQQVVENGNQEGGGLAGTGLGLADMASLPCRVWGRMAAWMGEAVLEAEIGNGVHQLVAQAQVVKPGLPLGDHLKSSGLRGWLSACPCRRGAAPAACPCRRYRLRHRLNRPHGPCGRVRAAAGYRGLNWPDYVLSRRPGAAPV